MEIKNKEEITKKNNQIVLNNNKEDDPTKTSHFINVIYSQIQTSKKEREWASTNSDFEIHASYKNIKQLSPIPSPLSSTLRCLFLNNNIIKYIEGLQSLSELRELHLNNNFVSKIENLEYVLNLTVLNLNNNKISKIEGLKNNKNLKNLFLQSNCLGISKLGAFDNLNEISQLEALDISFNNINFKGDTDIADFFERIGRLEKLKYADLRKNEFIRYTPKYRDTILDAFKELRSLDGMPIEERRGEYHQQIIGNRDGMDIHLDEQKQQQEVQNQEEQLDMIKRIKLTRGKGNQKGDKSGRRAFIRDKKFASQKPESDIGEEVNSGGKDDSEFEKENDLNTNFLTEID